MGADKLLENTQMSQNLSAQIVCQSPKNWDFDEKRLHWASVIRAIKTCPDVSYEALDLIPVSGKLLCQAYVEGYCYEYKTS